MPENKLQIYDLELQYHSEISLGICDRGDEQSSSLTTTKF
jgi:hypothetical protein